MESRQGDVKVARYDELVPYQSQLENAGIPRPLMEFLAAGKVYPILSPEGLVGRNAQAMVRGAPGLCVTILECVHGDGPQAHNHTGTVETFFCLDGRYEVSWGNELEHRLALEPNDLCSVPAGVYRAFKNLSAEPAHLMVFIQGDRNMSDRVSMHRSLGERIRAEYGEPVLEKLAGINMRFDGEAAAPFGLQKMTERVLRSGQWQAVAGGDGRPADVPLISPEPGPGAAVQGAAGSSVRMLECEPGAEFVLRADAGLSRSLCARSGRWTLTWDDGAGSLDLGTYDYVYFPDMKDVRVRSTSTRREQLLVIDQYTLN